MDKQGYSQVGHVPDGEAVELVDMGQPGTSFYQRFMGRTGLAGDFLGACLNKHDHQPLNRRGDGDIGAGHVGRYISLANPDRLSAFVCHIPGIILYSILLIFALLLYLDVSYFFTAFLSLAVFTGGWGCYLCVFGMLGVIKARDTCAKDWNSILEKYLEANPGMTEGMLHFVVFPNYAEDPDMMSVSIMRCANNPLSKDFMIPVLAMEAREGEVGQQKANELIARHRHCFKDMFATFHPPSIPGEVKGKSSNEQWAFRDIQRYYGNYVSQNPGTRHDPSKVFISICDADNLFHEKYFACQCMNALQQQADQRSWTMWQPPMVLMRNLETVPSLVRTASYGTFLFEFSNLYNTDWLDHLCFSTYTLTLALATHPFVDGWDTDVIAEDHHMYLKCLSAGYWEQVMSNETNRSVKTMSKLRINTIFCPVISYMPEEDGDNSYWGTVSARYQQAVRHMQGIAELSYICLQHANICLSSRESLPFRVHLQYFQLCLKYAQMTLINSANCILVLGVAMYSIFAVLQSFFQGSAEDLASETVDDIGESISRVPYLELALCFMPLVGAAAMCTLWCMIKDVLEGRYCPVYLQNIDEDTPYQYEQKEYCIVVRDAFGAESEMPLPEDPEELEKGEKVLKTRKMKFWSQLRLFAQVYTEFSILGQVCILLFGAIPVLLMSVHLSIHGHRFDYKVAGKPQAQKKISDNASISTKIGSAASSGSLSDNDDDALDRSDSMITRAESAAMQVAE